MAHGGSPEKARRLSTVMVAVLVALALGSGALAVQRSSSTGAAVDSEIPAGLIDAAGLDVVDAPASRQELSTTIPNELAFTEDLPSNDQAQPREDADEPDDFTLELDDLVFVTTTTTTTPATPAPPAKSTAPGSVGTQVPMMPAAPAGFATNPPVGGAVSWAGIGDAADPFVVATSAGYFLYTTNTSTGHVPVWHSADLFTWEARGDALPGLPVWAAPTATQTWAPAVLWRNGTWVLYFTTRHAASGRQCIGAAVSTDSTGPFVSAASEPLVCQIALGGSIDPSTVIDESGQAHLVFKNDGNCCRILTSIWSQRLAADGLSLVGSPTELLWSTDPWEGSLVEGPSMIHVGGRYHLIYSANSWASNRYAMGHAACESAQGPCYKSSASAWRTSLGGPGGGEFLIDTNGTPWLVFHEWRYRIGYPGGVRSLYLEPLSFDGSPPPAPTTLPPTTVPPTTVPSSTVPSTTLPPTTVPSTTVPPSTVPPTTVPSTTVPPTSSPPSSAPPATAVSTTTPTTNPATTLAP